MTLAYQCPIRKAARALKLEEIKEKKAQTYSNAAGNKSTVTLPQISQPLIDPDTTSKIISCMLHAHLLNTAVPGSYESELNKTLALNNLPQIKIPANPPSAAILKIQDTIQTTTNAPSPTQSPQQEDVEGPEGEEESVAAGDSDDCSEDDIPCGQSEATADWATMAEKEDNDTLTQTQGNPTPKTIRRKINAQAPPLAASVPNSGKNTVRVNHASLPQTNKKKTKKQATSRTSRRI